MNVTKSKMLLLLQSALCVILVVMLAAAAIGIYRDGVAEKQENPLAWIYTREKAAAALNTVMPVAVLAVAVTVTCAGGAERRNEERAGFAAKAPVRRLGRVRAVHAADPAVHAQRQPLPKR